jgi:hypothetical protein
MISTCPYCQPNSGGQHAPNCPYNSVTTITIPALTISPDMPQSYLPMGWLCPRCHKVNGPHVNSCDCSPVATYVMK